MVEKANTYSMFISHSKRHGFDPKLVDRCRKYQNEMRNYRDIKNTLEHISRTRKMV